MNFWEFSAKMDELSMKSRVKIIDAHKEEDGRMFCKFTDSTLIIGLEGNPSITVRWGGRYRNHQAQAMIA